MVDQVVNSEIHTLGGISGRHERPPRVRPPVSARQSRKSRTKDFPTAEAAARHVYAIKVSDSDFDDDPTHVTTLTSSSAWISIGTNTESVDKATPLLKLRQPGETTRRGGGVSRDSGELARPRNWFWAIIPCIFAELEHFGVAAGSMTVDFRPSGTRVLRF